MEEKSPIQLLFDLNFTEFLTTRIIKIIFVIGIVFAALAGLSVIVAGLQTGVLAGIAALIVAPVLFVAYVLVIRVWCEIVIVVFRIAENTGRMVDMAKGKTEPEVQVQPEPEPEV